MDESTRLMLLKILAKENRANWHEENEYKEEWCESMDAIAGYYEMKVISYVEKFLESPAGKRFQSDVAKARSSSHGTLPDMPPLKLRSYGDMEGLGLIDALRI